MTISLVAVAFPYGTVKYGLHHDTVDTFWSGLFDTSDEALEVLFSAYRRGIDDEFMAIAYPTPLGSIQPVCVTLNPEWPFKQSWPGLAARNALVAVDCERIDSRL